VFKACENRAWQRFGTCLVCWQGKSLAALLGAFMSKADRPGNRSNYFQMISKIRLHDSKSGFIVGAYERRIRHH
jgi:hypothetical protein